MFRHTIINVDNRCLDLLLTDDEIERAFNRALNVDNREYINQDICCKCWSLTDSVECCPFWKKIFGLCEHCTDTKLECDDS